MMMPALQSMYKIANETMSKAGDELTVLPQLGSHSPVPQLPFCSICHSTFQGVIWEQWAFRRGLGTLVGGAGDTCLSTYAVIQPFGV